MGNFIEFYDYGVLSFTVTVMAKVFFPSGNETVALLSVFAANLTAFVARPFGGAVWGRVGDLVGRRNVLVLTVLTMSLGTVGTGLLPPFSTWGLWSVILLVVCRLLQGLGASGEQTTAAIFVTEFGNPRRRALRASIIAAGTTTGVVLSTIVPLIMETVTTAEAYQAWGWRIAYLLAGPAALIALYLRWRVGESPEFEGVSELESQQQKRVSWLGAFRLAWAPALVFLMLTSTYTLAQFTVKTFFPAYLETTVGLTSRNTLVVALIVFSVLVGLCVPVGLLADRIGRRPLVIGGSLYMVVVPVPAFMIARIGGVGWALLAELLLIVGIASLLVPMMVSISEMFAPDIRSTVSGPMYNIATAAFGGTAPIVATWLIDATGSQNAMAFYMMAFAAVSAVVLIPTFKERAEGKTKKPTPSPPVSRDQEIGGGPV